MSLYPTKTRLSLLRAVDASQVLVDRYGQAAYADEHGAPNAGRLTGRWNEIAGAGWAERPDGDEPRWQPGQLTDAGRAVLEASK